jgi:uroporphyrinogen decarboxylase
MTPRERVLAAIEHRLTDRIPRFEIWIDMEPAGFGCSDSVSLYPHLGQDCIMMPSQQPAQSNAWQSGVDEFGRDWKKGMYVGGVVDSKDTLRKYTPSIADAGRYFSTANIDNVKTLYPDHCLIWGTHIGPFTAAYMAMGFMRFFTSLTDNPHFTHQVLETRTEWCIAMYKKAQELGADVLVIGDDSGTSQGPMISPKMWREFIFPYHQQIVNALDVPVIWHSDGDIVSLLPLAIDAGFTGYHGVDVIAGVNLRQVKNQFGKDLVIIGNLDVRVLFNEDLDAVHSEVNRCISEGNPGGGYMFSSCNSICNGMNPAAVEAMYKYLDKLEG